MKFYVNLKNLLTIGSTDFFSIIEMETTTECNRRCVYCPQYTHDRGKNLMSEDLFKKIIDELASINFIGRVSPHFYGEPLLDKRLPDLVKYIREKLPFSNIVIFSNGDLLTTELFHKLINSGVTLFWITIHGQTMSKNMNQLMDYVKDKPQLKEKIAVFKITPETPLFNRGGLVEPDVKIRFKKCRDPSDVVSVDHQGNVVLCCNDYLGSVIFGNLNNESLIQIWKKPYYKKVRKNIREGIFELEICKNCVK
jgi:radical SAM protein with 4Fe4S-binding SPASM domain